MPAHDPSRSIGLGIVGLGYAGRAMASAVERSPHFELRGVADPSAPAREPYEQAGVPGVDGVEALLALPEVEVVYVATPTVLHRDHALAIANGGRSAIVEKPLAADLTEADEVASAFSSRGLALVVGHSHSFDLPARALRREVERATYGRLLTVHNFCSTDWAHRTRKAEDLDRARGGGVSLRQGAHQFDILRLVCGGLARTVHAVSVPLRGATGDSAYSAIVEFEGGVTASAVYSGRGGFDSRLLSFGIGEAGERLSRPHAAYALASSGDHAVPAAPMFGFTVASFEDADVVPSPWGLLVHRPGDDVVEVPYPPASSGWDAVLDEAHDAITRGVPALHDGRWGVATLELCLAVGDSARAQRSVALHRQVPAAPVSMAD